MFIASDFISQYVFYVFENCKNYLTFLLNVFCKNKINHSCFVQKLKIFITVTSWQDISVKIIKTKVEKR